MQNASQLKLVAHDSAAFTTWLFTNPARMVVLMTGLDAAGNSSILYKLTRGEIVTRIPLVGFDVETHSYQCFDFVCWDAPTPGLRPFFGGTLIVVIDASDRSRMNDAVYECRQQQLDPALSGVPLLVFANKQYLTWRLRIS